MRPDAEPVPGCRRHAIFRKEISQAALPDRVR